jgi:hypothetical protein
MNRKKSLLIKLGILLSLLVVNVVAATPNSPCSIRASVLGIINVTIGGRVSANGRNCVPTNILPDILTPLRTGVVCNMPPDNILGIKASANCPN